MSQIWKSVASTPSVPTSFVTDDGTAIPAGNVLNVNGGETTANSLNGIETIANPNGSNNLQILLTNRATGTVTTTDGVTVENLITLDMGATPATYVVVGRFAAYSPGLGDGAGYFFEGVFKTDGATASIIGGYFSSFQEDASLTGVLLFVTDGGNNIIVEVTGIAATTIEWTGILEFTVAT